MVCVFRMTTYEKRFAEFMENMVTGTGPTSEPIPFFLRMAAGQCHSLNDVPITVFT